MLHAAIRDSREAKLPSRDTNIRRKDAAPSGWTIVRCPTIDSTNAEAHRRLAAGLAEKTVILASCQTAGRGRGIRVWESAADKGLWASFVLPVAVPCAALPQATLVLAVAVREAVERASGVRLLTKWPNDLLYGSRKCCGLLVETGMTAAAPRMRRHAVPATLVLGIGLNVNHLADDFPADLREKASSLRLATGREHRCEHMLPDMLAGVDHWFCLWAEQGFAPVREAWLAASCTLGKRIVLPDGYGYPHGTAHDLSPDGALVALADDGALVRIDAGEVVFCQARPSPSP